MNRKFIFGSIVALGILFFSTGCVVKMPKPYQTEVKKVSNVTQNEKQQILIKSMREIPRFCNSKQGECSRIKNNVISFRGTNTVFAHRFIIKNDKLYRIDVSRDIHCLSSKCTGKDAYGMMSYDWGFSDYINNYQKKLAVIYNKELDNYSKFKKEYLKKENIAVDRMLNNNVEIIDTTNLLPKNILKNIEYKTNLIYEKNPINLFIKNKPLKFTLVTNIDSTIIDRYKLIFDKNKYVCEVDTCPKAITFKIKKVYYNFVPEIFTAQNNDIDIVIVNSPDDNQKTIQQIKIVNKTTKFITINSVVVYYDGGVSDNVLISTDRIPPRSYITRETTLNYDFPKPNQKFIELTNKNQKEKYGVSVSYTINNAEKNLYFVKYYSPADFQ